MPETCPRCGTPLSDDSTPSVPWERSSPNLLHTAVRCNARRVDVLQAELARLQAIVDRLPKTADGVPVVEFDGPFFAVIELRICPTRECGWIPVNRNGLQCKLVARSGYRNDLGIWLDRWVRVEECYSTREAAEAAQKD